MIDALSFFRFGFGCVVILQTTIDALCQRHAEREDESARGFLAAPSCTVSDSCCPIPDGGRARASKNDRDDRARRRRSRRPGDCRTKRAVVAMKRRPIAAKQEWSMK